MELDYEAISLNIISCTGAARSLYMEAVTLAGIGEIEAAKEKIKEGKKLFVEGHRSHAELISQEANGIHNQLPLLLIHAEDQMAGTEITEQMAEQLVKLYEVLVLNRMELPEGK